MLRLNNKYARLRCTRTFPARIATISTAAARFGRFVFRSGRHSIAAGLDAAPGSKN
jgi:hypothetical protein